MKKLIFLLLLLLLTACSSIHENATKENYSIENDEYEHPVFPIIQEDFVNLGSPTVLVPRPQAGTDMGLFEEMMKMKTMWE